MIWILYIICYLIIGIIFGSILKIIEDKCSCNDSSYNKDDFGWVLASVLFWPVVIVPVIFFGIPILIGCLVFLFIYWTLNKVVDFISRKYKNRKEEKIIVEKKKQEVSKFQIMDI